MPVSMSATTVVREPVVTSHAAGARMPFVPFMPQRLPLVKPGVVGRQVSMQGLIGFHILHARQRGRAGRQIRQVRARSGHLKQPRN